MEKGKKNNQCLIHYILRSQTSSTDLHNIHTREKRKEKKRSKIK